MVVAERDIVEGKLIQRFVGGKGEVDVAERRFKVFLGIFLGKGKGGS